MQLYHSFKAEIADTEDPKLKEKLLHVMLDVVRDKPAANKKHKDPGLISLILAKPMEKLAEKMNAF